MPLTPGTRLGAYEIDSPIGAGGMGAVYKARDTRLDRTVAIKVLPDHVAADPTLRKRFELEAKAISSLNHPHICTLHDVGHHEGTDFLVLEYLEGETLSERIARSPLEIVQALTIATQIASALDQAHRAGIVHRDLKPANIFLLRRGSPSGQTMAKLLDFGLAKSNAPVVSGSALSVLPTTPAGVTVQGSILGTFQYMAPEQIEGLEADARTDIFAFGLVLFEMLTGRPAFEGKTRASLLGAILKELRELERIPGIGGKLSAKLKAAAAKPSASASGSESAIAWARSTNRQMDSLPARLSNDSSSFNSARYDSRRAAMIASALRRYSSTRSAAPVSVAIHPR